jgi:hypothetical protein
MRDVSCCGVLAEAGVATEPVVAGSDGVVVNEAAAPVVAEACDPLGWGTGAETGVAVPVVAVASESADVSV